MVQKGIPPRLEFYWGNRMIDHSESFGVPSFQTNPILYIHHYGHDHLWNPLVIQFSSNKVTSNNLNVLNSKPNINHPKNHQKWVA